MTITITQTTFGFHIALVSDDRQRFAQVLESFKLAIPKRNRLFNEVGRFWFVDKRKEKKLRQWLEGVKQAGEANVYEVSRIEELTTGTAASNGRLNYYYSLLCLSTRTYLRCSIFCLKLLRLNAPLSKIDCPKCV